MRKVLAALMEVTGLGKFFTGVTVELPAYFLPNFRVVEMHDAKRARVRPLRGVRAFRTLRRARQR